MFNLVQPMFNPFGSARGVNSQEIAFLGLKRPFLAKKIAKITEIWWAQGWTSTSPTQQTRLMQEFWQNQTLPNLQEITAAEHIVGMSVLSTRSKSWQALWPGTLVRMRATTGGKPSPASPSCLSSGMQPCCLAGFQPHQVHFTRLAHYDCTPIWLYQMWLYFFYDPSALTQHSTMCANLCPLFQRILREVMWDQKVPGYSW